MASWQDLYGPASDKVTLDGQYLYFSEMDPNFPLSTCKLLPPPLAGLTTAQMATKFNLTLGGATIPPDAVPLAGSMCLVSANRAESYLPNMVVSETVPGSPFGRNNFQITNQASGFVLQVLDSTRTKVAAAPVNLIDKSWNVLQITADGIQRGVLVYCDSTIASPPPAFEHGV